MSIPERSNTIETLRVFMSKIKVPNFDHSILSIMKIRVY